MKYHTLQLIITAFVVCVFSGVTLALSSREKEAEVLKQKNQKLEELKARVEASRDSLQNEIAGRWQAKQRFVQQRETDKETIDQLRETLERSYSELSQVKEESFARLQALDEERKNLSQRKEDWSYVGSTQNDMFQKQADDLKESMPLEMENRRAALENIRRKFKNSSASYTAFIQFLEYKRDFIRTGSLIGFEKKTVLTDNGPTQLLNLVRFGTVFAYGIGDKNQFYFINQTGRLGEARYSIDRIEATGFVAFLQEAFPKWLETKTVTGTVMLDIMQNAQSKSLFAGTKISAYQKLYFQIKAGGAVMIPLLLLAAWALVLTLIKIIQFGTKKERQRKVFRKINAFLDNKDREGALAYLKKQRLAFAGICRQFLSNPSWSRSAAEKLVQEVMIGEMPRLTRYLNTLAVMAGAAPLLGLLGTISGMINLFSAVTYHGTGDPKFLAGGISEALITAKTGLAIAIPVLFIHDYLRNRKDQIQADIEAYSVQVINRLWPKE